MADYWKSQPKKFCQYCKCWIADNKPSIEFHERGKNHKENVAAKISEIKKKSIDKAKQEDRMSKEFAAMEEAAMKAYQEDLKRIEAESASAEAESTKSGVTTEAPSSTGTDTWLEGVSEEGHTYYYNTVTGKSQWEKPKGYQGKKQKPAKLKQGNEKSQSGHWMEAQSPEGYTYYYNTETGESSWEKPEGYCSPEGTSEGREATEQEDLDTPRPEQGSSDSPAPAQDPESSRILPVSKISFRKRKLEKPVESEEEEKADNGEDDGKEEEADDGEDDGNDEMEDLGEKSASSDGGETEGKNEEKDGEEETGKEEVAVKRPRNTNPYGAWEQIQAEPDPYENVDLQLPHVEDLGTTPAPSDLPPEPKVKFKERTITSLGDESGAGAVFRRRKAENGKSRSLRQRAEDS